MGWKKIVTTVGRLAIRIAATIGYGTDCRMTELIGENVRLNGDE